MELVTAQSVFDEARCLLEGKGMDGEPCEKNVERAETLLHEVLNNNLGQPTVLYTLGSLYLEKGNYGLAIQLLSQVTGGWPKFGEAWNNLAMAFRGVNEWDKAAHCAKKAAALLDHADIPCNVAGLYLNRGMPEDALEWADTALEKDPDHVKAQWHKATALLELGRWHEAWPLHESRLVGGAHESIAERNYHGANKTPWWDGKTAEKVVVHGEQGMGDEIMFASCLPDAIATGAEIIFEPSPRLHGLFTRSFPKATVYGTNEVDGRDWIGSWGRPDSKVALGSLPKFYRNRDADFPITPYLVASPEKREFWAGKLKALGDRLMVGLAWQGGVPATRVEARSFHPANFAPLFGQDCAFISLQYDATARRCVDEVTSEFDVTFEHWPKAVEAIDQETGEMSDLDEVAALIDELDLVITIPTTSYHVAGALGVPTWVLTQSEPDWRLGVTRASTPWYNSVSLIRQERAGDWASVIEEAARRLGTFIETRKRA